MHGTATSPAVWDRLVPYLEGYDVQTPQRPRTGDLVREADWLADLARGSWLVGMSGGATLGLAVVAGGTPLAGAVLHEPAVGSLCPDLLAPVAAAFDRGGTQGLARALYGDSWTPSMVETDDPTTAAELAMFREFEPGPPSAAAGEVVVTVGASSPEPRHRAARALAERWGYATRPVPGAAHFAAWDHPQAFAGVVRAALTCARA